MKFKKTKWGSRIIKDQMDLIRKLSGMDVRLDAFGEIGVKNDIFMMELNFYLKDYPKNDEFKGRRKFASNVDCTKESDIIFDLQNVIDVIYAIKYKEPCPRSWYFPNMIPELGIDGASFKSNKKIKKTLKESVRLR